MTLNLAQLLRVVQREENWSPERIARRAQPAGSPAGISFPPHHPAARPPDPGPASAQRRRPEMGAAKRNGSERREWGGEERGRGAQRGRESAEGGGLEEV